MRGLPPLQALLLLITLVILGFAGRSYIRMDETNNQPAPVAKTNVESRIVEAEIEFIFSSPPLSYTLTQPSADGEENQVLLTTTDSTENPCYEIVQLVSNQSTTYWLDVVWPEAATNGGHHFVQIYIAPNHGDHQRFSFFATTKSINETFDYNTGDHHE